MGAPDISAMAAGMKDSAGPTMLFAEVNDRIEGGTASGGRDKKLTKEETDEVGGRLRDVSS